MKRRLLSRLVFILPGLLATGSAAAAERLRDEEMDQITAVAPSAAIGSSAANPLERPVAGLTLSPNAQTGLRAVSVNNIAGNNQVATAINIAGKGSPGR